LLRQSNTGAPEFSASKDPCITGRSGSVKGSAQGKPAPGSLGWKGTIGETSTLPGALMADCSKGSGNDLGVEIAHRKTAGGAISPLPKVPGRIALSSSTLENASGYHAAGRDNLRQSDPSGALNESVRG